MKLRKSVTILLCLLALLCQAGISQDSRVQADSGALLPNSLFSNEELDWLQEHPVVRVAPDPDFPPVEFIDKEGNYHGIAADFIALLESKLPLHFEIIPLKDWDEVISQAKTREIDMLGAAVPNPDRLQYLKFSQPFVEFPAVIIVRDSTEISPKIKNLEGMRVAVVSNYAAHDYMLRAHPEVPLEIMPDIASGLRQVSFGKVDAMVLNLASASYYIGKEGITNLKIYKDTDFVYDLSFATRSDWPLLNTILQKAVASISSKERKAILDRWISLKQEAWRPSPQLIIILATLVLAAIFTAIILWNSSLRQQVQERTADLKKELADRLKAEEEKQELQLKIHRSKKMAALGLLAGGVAHDLNNILSGIVGYPDIILMDLPDDSPLRPPLQAIRSSGERAAAVVADLLTLARGAASDKKVLVINTIIEEYLNSPEHSSLCQLYPELHIDSHLDPDILNILCSESHIRKTLMNLVINGAEATQKGLLTIRTENRALDRPHAGYDTIPQGEYVVLTIGDTGTGIAAGDLDHIFEPFYSKKKMGRSGTGLGLAVVWNTMLDHKGFIDVISSEAGTTFELFFPVSREEACSVKEIPALADLQGNGEVVLIIDDEETIRAVGSHMLTCLGYKAEAVAGGEEALVFLEEHRADLLLLDMIMDPGINGYETFVKIKARHPDQKAIIASGFSESAEVKKTQELGAGRYLRKPYSIERLGKAIQEELRRSR